MFTSTKKVVFKIVINKKKTIFDRMPLTHSIVGTNMFSIYVFYCNWNLRPSIDFKGKKNPSFWKFNKSGLFGRYTCKTFQRQNIY